MTDLDAAVARLTKWSEQDRNSAGARDARLLLADWERRVDPLACCEAARGEVGAMALRVQSAEAERDAARAEVERLRAAHFECDLAKTELREELARLRERDARVRELLEHVSTHLGVATAGIAPAATARAALDISPSLVREAIALLKETP